MIIHRSQNAFFSDMYTQHLISQPGGMTIRCHWWKELAFVANQRLVEWSNVNVRLKRIITKSCLREHRVETEGFQKRWSKSKRLSSPQALSYLRTAEKINNTDCSLTLWLGVRPWVTQSFLWTEPKSVTIHWKAVKQLLYCGAFFQFYPVCSLGKFINFGLGTVGSERVKVDK